MGQAPALRAAAAAAGWAQASRRRRLLPAAAPPPPALPGRGGNEVHPIIGQFTHAGVPSTAWEVKGTHRERAPGSPACLGGPPRLPAPSTAPPSICRVAGPPAGTAAAWAGSLAHPSSAHRPFSAVWRLIEASDGEGKSDFEQCALQGRGRRPHPARHALPPPRPLRRSALEHDLTCSPRA